MGEPGDGGSSTADETNKQQDVLAPTDTDAQRLPVELQHIISGTNLTSDWPFAYQWAFGSTTGALPARRVLRASDGTALVGPIEVYLIQAGGSTATMYTMKHAGLTTAVRDYAADVLAR